jgi:hypothetical protein
MSPDRHPPDSPGIRHPFGDDAFPVSEAPVKLANAIALALALLLFAGLLGWLLFGCACAAAAPTPRPTATPLHRSHGCNSAPRFPEPRP